MKKKELKKRIKQLEEENYKLRTTRIELIEDVRVLLGNDNHYEKAMVGVKYNLLWDTEKMIWKGHYGDEYANGFIEKLRTDKNTNDEA